MINRYRRAARSAQELNLGPLAPLDAVVPELRPAERSERLGHERDTASARLAKNLGKTRWRRRESNLAGGSFADVG
jgi:hypothetical protein